MKARVIKVIKTLGVIGIILLSIFVVITYNEISSINAIVKDRDLSVKILPDVATGVNPQSIEFESLVLNSKGKVKYYWEFGDGKTSEEANPTNLYEKNGEYRCKLTVTAENGKKAEDTLPISIEKNKPPIVVLTLNKNAHQRKFTVYSMIPVLWPGDVQKIINRIEARNPYAFGEGSVVCTAQINDPENDDIVSYEWLHEAESQLSMFGKTEYPTHNISGNETIRIPEIYTWPRGRHVVTLTVVDSLGNRANASAEFQVEDSETKIKINQLKNLILTLFLNTIYEQYLSEEAKHLLSDPLWRVIDLFDIIFSKIPIIRQIWGIVLSFAANKFPPPVPKAELTCSFDNSVYDHSTTVNENGGVTNNVSISHTVTIENTDQINPAKDVYLLLKNPVTDEEGLENELEKNELIISLKTADATRTLYYNNVYTNGISIGDLEPGADFTAELTVTFQIAEDNTFVDNKNYNCTFYVHQDEADYSRWFLLLKRPPPEEVNFEIIT